MGIRFRISLQCRAVAGTGDSLKGRFGIRLVVSQEGSLRGRLVGRLDSVSVDYL